MFIALIFKEELLTNISVCLFVNSKLLEREPNKKERNTHARTHAHTKEEKEKHIT